MEGGAGSDILFGGAGHDAFLFAGQFGDDFVRDYDAGETLIFEGFTGDDVTLSGGRSAILTVENGGTVTLLGIAPEDFDMGALTFTN